MTNHIISYFGHYNSSWIEHPLVRADYLRRADAKAWALYLVLGTVGGKHGLS
jgi:hypothetical protein